MTIWNKKVGTKLARLLKKITPHGVSLSHLMRFSHTFPAYLSEHGGKPFSWNDNLSEIALEDFSMIQKSLPCGAEYYASGIKGLSKGKHCEECGQKLDWGESK